MKIAIVMGVVLFGYLFVQNWKPDQIESGIIQDNTITVDSVKNRMKIEKLILIDVRTIQEYNNDHIAGALLIPLDELPNRIHELDSYRSEELIMVCRSGNRSGHATDFLNKNGFTAKNMLGGMIKWNRIK